MPKQNPWPLTNRIAIRNPGPEDCGFEQAGIGKELG